MRLQHFAVAQVHVHAARQTWIEASHRAHDVDALEFVRAVFLEDRRVLHRILVGPGRAVDIARIRVPRRGRIGMIVGDLAIADDDVMREHTAHRLVEAAADGFFGNLEVGPRSGAAGVQLRRAPARRSSSAAAAA